MKRRKEEKKKNKWEGKRKKKEKEKNKEIEKKMKREKILVHTPPLKSPCSNFNSNTQPPTSNPEILKIKSLPIVSWKIVNQKT